MALRPVTPNARRARFSQGPSASVHAVIHPQIPLDEKVQSTDWQPF